MEGVLQKDPYLHKQEDSFQRHSIKVKRYKAENSVEGSVSDDDQTTEVNMPLPRKLR